MIAVIDYDAGNLYSVEKALDHLGKKSVITGDPDQILKADHVILPGVGAFADAMDKLTSRGLDEVVREAVLRSIPLLGICLGMQLLFDGSQEGAPQGDMVKGLAILPGVIKRIPAKDPDTGSSLKIPHMGWNSLQLPNKGRLFDERDEGAYVYFVHSYYLEAAQKDIVTATTTYGVEIHASVERDSLFGCQFHPEKSGETGLEILRRFVEI